MASQEDSCARAEQAFSSDKGQELVDGIQYLTFGLVSDFAAHIEKIRDLELREDDVFQVGYPRSGNQWVLDVVSMVLRQSATFSDRTVLDSLVDLQQDLVEKLNSMVSPRQLVTHLRMNRLPVDAIKKRIRLVYIIRNPKDVLVSLYRFMSSYAGKNSQFTGTWSEFFEIHMAGEFSWGTWFDHVLSLDTFLKYHPECPIYICSYEELKLTPVKVIGELCSFFQRPQNVAEEIAVATQFEDMKSVLAKGKLQETSSFFKDKTINNLLHTGTIYGWKNYFTTAQSERFDKAFEEKLAVCATADLVRPYMQ